MMDNREILLCAENISKSYNGRMLLKSISLRLYKGEAICIVGKNGTGKSTLLRILSGLTSFDSGKLIIDRQISKSFIPDGFEKSNMTIRKFMRYLYDMDDYSNDPNILKKYYEKYAIIDMIDTPMKFLSKGSLQKVAVIQALISERDVIFMDEPLAGQDTVSKELFFEEIREKKNRGMGMVIACHEKEMIYELADKIYCLEKGVLVDGYRYIYEKESNKVLFVLYRKEGVDIVSEVNELLPKESDIKMTLIENKIRLEMDKSFTDIMFQYVMKKGIKISRYEELADHDKK